MDKKDKEKTKYCMNPLHYLPNNIVCSKWHMKLSEWKKVKAKYEN